MNPPPSSFVVQLNPAINSVRCSLTARSQAFSTERPLGRCSCCEPAAPLIVGYTSAGLRGGWQRQGGPQGTDILRRYGFALPAVIDSDGYGAGVGVTPIVRHEQLSSELDLALFIKSEAQNPSGSFKDRGLSVAILLGYALGARQFCVPTQGNAGVAAALFSARLGLPPCEVWMPATHENSYYYRAARHYGANVTLAGANIAETGQAMRRAYEHRLNTGELVDVSTFYEPGRLEGKKTLGYEIWEAFRPELPEVIVYPTGGGTGLVGIHKAFEELQQCGVLGPTVRIPRLIAVQAEGCAPLVQAFTAGANQVLPVQSSGTIADGLNVPAAIMGHEMLRSLRASKGLALTVSDAELHSDFRRLAELGVVAGFETAATLSAVRRLLALGEVASGERVLLLATSGPNAHLSIS